MISDCCSFRERVEALVENRKFKIAIDILLTIFFIMSYGIIAGMRIQPHVVIGIIAAILSFVHVWINRKRWLPIFKISTIKKLTNKAKGKYAVSLLLTIVWGVCIITGVFIAFPAIIYSLAGVEDLFLFFVTHMFSAMLSVILVILHIVQHISQIKSYFKSKH